SVYLAPGEQQLHKKGCRWLVHVSYFILESTGHLVLPAHLIHELKLSGRWTNRLNASAVAIKIFNILHPNDVAVFFFDCSSAHEAFAPDALSVQRMNVKLGGNQPVMHDTIIPDDCPIPSKCRTIQSMVFTAAETSDPKLIGVPKGMPIIAAANKGQVIGTCHLCKLSATKHAKLEEDTRKQLEDDGKHTYIDEVTLGLQSNHTDCCLSRALGSQKDFSHEKSMLETVIEAAGHKCVFLPKFHCELNPIEPIWGFAK
ncbi:hypothetical protein K439DRAFT_1286553, partial [Ramaria rubella]